MEQTKANQESNLTDMFVKEKMRLKNIVYDEISLIEAKRSTNTKCNVEMLKDVIFVIDKGFDDIMKELNVYNLKEKQRQLNIFKESLIFSIYGN